MVSKDEFKDQVDTVKETAKGIWKLHALRVIGAMGLATALMCGILGLVKLAWLVLISVGLIDLYLIYGAKEITISRWMRSLTGHRVDNIIMIGLCVAIWGLKGEVLALWFLLGLLNNHLFERND